MTWDIGTRAPIIAMSGLTLEADGSLQCDARKGCEGSAPGANVVVGVAGAIGQPRRFILAGKDKQPLAMGEVIPFPASGSDGNCSAEAVLISPGGEMVLLFGSGFEPGESVVENALSAEVPQLEELFLAWSIAYVKRHLNSCSTRATLITIMPMGQLRISPRA